MNDTNIHEKQCKSCGQTKPLLGFYKNKDGRQGHYSRCIACHKTAIRDSNAKAATRNAALPLLTGITRVCTGCHTEKPIEEFIRDRRCTGGYGTRCKPCTRNNSKRWYDSPKGREYSRQRTQELTARLKVDPELKRKHDERNRTYLQSARGKSLALDYQMRTKYGITREEFERMNEAQQGLCAICHAPPKRYRLCVDHCHKTGKVRGLLCSYCNGMIGKWGDDPAVAERAMLYLLIHKS